MDLAPYREQVAGCCEYGDELSLSIKLDFDVLTSYNSFRGASFTKV